MKTTYLDYYKNVLKKVSFNPSLFTKELKKAQQTLTPIEKQKLYSWLEMEGMITHIPLKTTVDA